MVGHSVSSDSGHSALLLQKFSLPVWRLGGVVIWRWAITPARKHVSFKGYNSNIIVFSDLGWNLPLTNNKMMSDASDMLAAALEQMDGIIAGNLRPLEDGIVTFTPCSWLFHSTSFITSPLSYFHLWAALIPLGFTLIPLLHFIPVLFSNFVLKCVKFHFCPRVLTQG